MKPIATDKIRNALGNGLWQLIPSVATLLLSLLTVRLFSAEIWGAIVSVIVIQQIANSIAAWGNKDFLQREMARNASRFHDCFTAFFRQRLLVLALVLAAVFICRIVPQAYFVPFSLMVLGRFLQQSFDIAVVRERRFAFAVWLEVLFLAGQLAGILALHRIGATVPQLLALFWIPLVLKGIVLCIVFRGYFSTGKTDGLLLRPSFFFAMMGLSGLVHGKVDLLLVSVTLDDATLGKYQIITGFLWNIQSVALYVSSPYIHNFYRLNESSQNQYALTLKRLGFIVVPLGVIAMVLLLRLAFRIEVEWNLMAAFVLFGMASFIYLPWIFRLNQRQCEHRVLMANLGGTALLAVLILSADHLLGLTLERVIWIVSIHQALVAAIVFLAHKKPKTCVAS